ncbi:unnamed protein product [Bubo scandiacus]
MNILMLKRKSDKNLKDELERLASGNQKSQPALQKDTPQENKKGYTTNTNFMSVYEPQFNHNMQKCNQCHSQSSSSERKYYFSRNIPHPRMVCHIPGLNNALICVVRNSFSREHPSAGNTVILEQEAHQEHVITGSAKSNTSGNCYLPKLEGFMQRELGTSQFVTQGHADVPERIKTSPTSSEKLLKKEFQAFATPANREGIHVPPLTQPSSPFNNLDYSPHTQKNGNSDLSYLDQKIKVLEKLSKILQTDSLIEIKKWLTRASKKEKDFMSSLIYSELSDKGVLNSKEDTAENMNSLSLPQLPSPLQRGPEGEINQSRSSSKQSVASRNMKQERERMPLPSVLRTSPARANTVPREELQLRKSYGNKSPSRLHTLSKVSCVPQPPLNNRYPLSSHSPLIQSH